VLFELIKYGGISWFVKKDVPEKNGDQAESAGQGKNADLVKIAVNLMIQIIRDRNEEKVRTEDWVWTGECKNNLFS
jgi:ABC-type sulfate transport system substrate-binding protein